MSKRKRPAHISAKDWKSVDSPALSDATLQSMRPTEEIFPDLVKQAKRKRGQRGPQKKPRKMTISLRLDSAVIDAYKAGGRGYQTRMAAILEKNAR